MIEDFFVRVAKKVELLPPLPASVDEVMRVVNDPESSAKDLTQAILPDQSLCVTILKYANSALYGRPKEVSSIEDAIVVLGFNEIQNIVMSKSVISSFGNVLNTNNAVFLDFWDHSFSSALAAKVIADSLNLSLTGQFFIGGLIHDIGKLAMYITSPDEYQAEYWMTTFSTPERLQEEQETFGTTHQEVGYKLLGKWNFPEPLLAALRHHHQPQESEKFLGFPTLIQLADAMAYLCCQEEEILDEDIKKTIEKMIPGIDKRWHQRKLPWSEVRLETWLNWVRIDRRHGSSILAILSHQ